MSNATMKKCPAWCELEGEHTLCIGEVGTTGEVDVTLYEGRDGVVRANLTAACRVDAAHLREGAALMSRAAAILEGSAPTA